jgi:transcriptional regulator with XRE-family HTH domain
VERKAIGKAQMKRVFLENKSLAQFVSETREKIGLSQSGLAKKTALSLETIEDIESGQELFLASTVRQKLARGLKLNPLDIKPYEKRPDLSLMPDTEVEIFLKQKILDNDVSDIECPVCGSRLITRIAKMYDLEDNLILVPKARCEKCPFQIRG